MTNQRRADRRAIRQPSPISLALARCGAFPFVRRGPFALVRALLAALVAFLVSVPLAHAASGTIVEGRRVALVIGNGRYEHVESLANPPNDGAAISERLGSLEFEVFDGRDLALTDMRRLIDRFVQAAETADTAVVYYSGHAFQMRGLNYLVPADAALKTKAAIATETLRLDTLLGDLEAPGRQVLAFLDACRNNPLPPSQRREDGLVQVQVGKDVFVAFATAPGLISYDGRGEHSPFTQGLIDHMGTPGQSVSDMMIAVRNSVEAHTLHQQTPWDQSSLRRQVYFNPTDGSEAERAALEVASLEPTIAARRDAILSRPRTLGLLGGGDEPASGDEAAETSEETVNPAAGAATPEASISAAPSETAALEPTEAPLSGDGTGLRPRVVTVPDLPRGVLEGEDLVFAVQEQLARIGCYRSTVDGIWGNGSRAAAAGYFKTKKVNAVDTEPSDFLLRALEAETGEVCAPPPPPKRATPQRSTPKATVNRAAPKRAAPKRAAPTRKASTPKRSAPARRTASRPAAKPAPKKTLAGAKLTGGLR